MYDDVVQVMTRKDGTKGMEWLGRKRAGKVERPIKVLQFGEGNFLRGFVDQMIDIANEKGVFDGDVVIVKPTDRGGLEKFKAQECQYTVILRGLVDGEAKSESRIVTCVADAVHPYQEYEKYAKLAELESLRFVVSNTTEAGIVFDETDKLELCPPKTFPGKLCKFLYERYQTFHGDASRGLVMLPVELIDDNGKKLKDCVLQLAERWGLEKGFTDWIDEACEFASTLVDRIIAGYPKDEAAAICENLGYQDDLLVVGEPFGLWVIESKKDLTDEFPLQKAGQPVVYTDDHKPYKQRKVRILNGAHTSFVLASYLCGNDIVLESMQDADVDDFAKKTIYEEVMPTLSLPKENLEAFAQAVFERFANPYVKHALLSISLNSVSKWRARCMPSLLAYLEKEGKLPKRLVFSMAALLAFYTGSELRGNALIGHRGNAEYEIKEDASVLEFFAANSGREAGEYAKAVLSNEAFWGRDLSAVPSFVDAVAADLAGIREVGMRDAIRELGKA